MNRIAFCACAVLLVPMGCGGGGDSSSVSFQLFGDPEELQVYRDLVAAYEEGTGEDVEMVEVADREAHLQKLTTSFAGGSPPDVFLVNYRNYGGYADRGVLDPVGPRLEASEAIAREQFYSQPMEAFTFDGELQCMPQNASSLVVYYNRDMFEEIGLPEPARDWSYAEFRATAVELTTAEHDGLGVEPGVVRAAPFVWSAGGELVDDPTAPTRFSLNSDAAQAGLEAFLDLAQFGPSHQEYEAKPLEERFLDGELAMFMSSRREVPVFRTITEFDWDVATFPILGVKTGILHSDAYCLTEGDNADAGWEFIEFAVGPEGQRLAAEGGRTVPSMKSVARSDAFLDPSQPPASSEIFLEAIPNIRRLPISPNWAQVEEAADLALEEAFFEGGGEIEELLRRIRQETAGKF